MLMICLGAQVPEIVSLGPPQNARVPFPLVKVRGCGLLKDLSLVERVMKALLAEHNPALVQTSFGLLCAPPMAIRTSGVIALARVRLVQFPFFCIRHSGYLLQLKLHFFVLIVPKVFLKTGERPPRTTHGPIFLFFMDTLGSEKKRASGFCGSPNLDLGGTDSKERHGHKKLKPHYSSRRKSKF